MYEEEARERQKLTLAQPGEKVGSKVTIRGGEGRKIGETNEIEYTDEPGSIYFSNSFAVGMSPHSNVGITLKYLPAQLLVRGYLSINLP